MASKTPPNFNPEEGDDYNNWKMDVAVWRMVTKDEKKKHGPAVYLALQGSAREKVRTIEMAQLNREDGFEKVIELLDSVYLKDESTRAYMAFKEFVEYRRKMGESYSTFIVSFEKLNTEITKHNMELPDGAKAYFLLQAANLNEENERLARVSANMNYNHMKDTLHKVFGNGQTAEGETLPVKTEEVNFTRKNFSGRGYNHGSRSEAGFSRRRQNPTNRFNGKPMKCFTCGSTEHLIKDCPRNKQKTYLVESNEEVKESEEVKVVYLTKESNSKYGSLMVDTIGFGVLDSACTKTVAGTNWIEEYLQLISKQDENKMERKKSFSVFRFGDGIERKAKYTLTIPAVVAGCKIWIGVDVVDCDIPLLLSKETMKKLDMNIDFGTGIASVLGMNVDLMTTNSGHYCIPLVTTAKEHVKIVLDESHIKEKSQEDLKKIALKLHRQFCHASFDRLKKLLIQAGTKEDGLLDVLETTCKECSFCNKYKKQYPRPVVALLETEFNAKVSMDLKQITDLPTKTWILHLVDSATRYTAAALIKTKKKELVVEKIMMIWVAYFGAPRKFHSDCGGEFSNEVLEEMAHKLGCEISTTPSEAPFSNGIVERNNKVLYEAAMKTKEDVKCSLETALAWAVAAKNGLQNHGGYSPNQLVIGYNVNIPSVLTDKLPALTTNTQSDMLREKLNALHAARQNFCKAEASNKIKVALRHQIRTYADQVYEQGDQVYYRRKDSKDWNGPARVIGKDGNFVLLREGAKICRCHPCQLVKTIDAEGSTQNSSTVVDNAKIDLSDSESEGPAMEDNENLQQQELQEDDNEQEATNTLEHSSTETAGRQSNACASNRILQRLQPHNKPGKQESSYFTQSENQAKYEELQVMQRENQAKYEELQKLIQYDVYETVDDVGQQAISCKWIITNKGEKTKARLVARGFEEEFRERKDSPTCTRESLRMIFAVSSSMQWTINSMGISSAFLQSNELQRTVYIKPPKECADKGKV